MDEALWESGAPVQAKARRVQDSEREKVRPGSARGRWLSRKASACTAGDTGDLGSIPGPGRSPEEGMATHSRVLAWRIPRTEQPGGLQPPGHNGVGHHLATKQRQQTQ